MGRTGRSLRQVIFSLLGIFLPIIYSRFEYCMFKITGALNDPVDNTMEFAVCSRKGRRMNTLENILFIFLV
jgi:hypothetical protein